MPVTYDSIATQTLGSAAASITFSSIAGTYTDLRVVLVCTNTAGADTYFRFNGDSGANYSITALSGSGTNAQSASPTGMSGINPNQSYGITSTTIPSLITWDIFSYAGSTKKTVLCTASQDKNGSGNVIRVVGLWGNTAAITSITIAPSANFNAGTTATLYGIKAA